MDCLSKSEQRHFVTQEDALFSTFKEIDMAENEAMELQAMLPGGQVTGDASSVPVSSQQASESIIVQIEQEEDGKSCCMR